MSRAKPTKKVMLELLNVCLDELLANPKHGMKETCSGIDTVIRRSFEGVPFEGEDTPLRWHLVPCPGDAHSNPNIDNCGQCMPRWGEVVVPVRFKTVQEYWTALRGEGGK